ncbi:MAG: GntR family transcriptional regulator [Leucobacter sp.]|jgi:DNA-binding transcriptional regulator YhcF (GntR family)|nr:GntR family transcriptional regulator [Leucobacter sp.]
MIEITIDETSAEPPFAQLREGILDQITSGTLAPGSKLPPVRALATHLGLAANTVARTYRELEATGFVETRGRGGTVVTPQLDDAEQHRRALTLTREYVGAMRALGITRSTIAEYLARDEA